MKLTELSWLAGLLDGEGAFVWHKTIRDKGRPRIEISMTDRDVVERVAAVFHSNTLGPYGPYTTQKKHYWYTHVSGARAIAIMLSIYTFMSHRRKQRIEELLLQWKAA